MKRMYALLFFVFPALLFAQAHLEFDWNTERASLYVRDMAIFQDRVYFIANDGCHDLEPWVYDPVTQKASMVADLVPGGGIVVGISQEFYEGKVYYFNDYGIYRYDPVTDEVEKISNLFAYSKLAFGDKVYFTAKRPETGKLTLYALDIQTKEIQEITFSYGISETDFSPQLFISHKGYIYLVGKNELNKSRIYRYNPSVDSLYVLPAPPEVIDHSFGDFPVQTMASAEGKLLIGMSMQHLTGYNLCAYNDTTDQIVPLAAERITSSFSCVYQGAIYYHVFNGGLRKYDLNTGVLITDFNIAPGVPVKVYGLKVMENELYADTQLDTVKKICKWNEVAQVFEPVPELSDFITTSLISHDKIERINGQYVYVGTDNEGVEAFMEFTPGNTAPSMVNRISQRTKGSSLNAPVSLGDQAYIWDSEGELIRFETTGADPNPVVVNDALGIDATSTGIKLFALEERMFLTGVRSQGITYAFSLLKNGGDTLQHFLPGFQTPATQFTSFQGQVYLLTDSTGSTRRVYRYQPQSDSLAEVLAGMITGKPLFLTATDQYLYIFTSSNNIYRYDGVSLAQVTGNFNLNSAVAFQPFFTGSQLLFKNVNTDPSGSVTSEELLGLNPESMATHPIANSKTYGQSNVYYPVMHQNACWMTIRSLGKTPFFRMAETGDSLVLVYDNTNALEGGLLGSPISLEENLLVNQVTSEYGFEWYRFDPTTAEMERLTDINPLTGRGVVSEGKVIGSKLYFQGDDGIHGRELWSYRNCYSATLAVTPTEYGDSTGQITVNVTGGAEPFTYEWSNGGSGPTQTNLPEGVHQVTTTDANGCKSTLYTCLESVVTVTGKPEVNSAITVKAYPNPFGEWLYLESELQTGKSCRIQLIDLQGNIVRTADWQADHSLSFPGDGLPAGLYFLHVRDVASGVVQTLRVVKGN